MRRILLPLVIAVLALAACDGGGPEDLPSPADSGIRGTITAGPQCPVIQAGSPCPDAPWEGRVRITGDDVDIEVATFAPGRFRVALEPGTYRVQPEVAGPGTAAPATVEVPGQGYARIALTVDTGIR